ncbi:MAG: bifunctional hydroxymethylpyrimidine kinase/phosphomethylpyrimidine kinase [Planctomycetota bacterium]|nr:bifunctional hydroxymethylpyrimidine kinase/phosphomethylpyrimidine kinase [Planctomycetota bacterium]
MSELRLTACGGVDSSGGAGLDADGDAAARLGVELAKVITAHTVQDDDAVHQVTAVEPTDWIAQLSATRPTMIKFGLLPGAAHVAAAAAWLHATPVPAVVDPVLAASSGYRFLDAEACEVLRTALCAAGPVLTPNLNEAAALVREAALVGDDACVAAAGRLLEAGARGVVLKGGHGTGPTVRELVLEPGADPVWIEHPRLPGSLRGSGCRFATALALLLAQGAPLGAAARGASALVAGCFAAR